MMPLFCVVMPANAKDFFKMILQIAAFDFIDLTEFYSNLFNIELTEAIDDTLMTSALGRGTSWSTWAHWDYSS